ncbi:MAG: A24 family peptidase [Candidatus Pacearchaeota archaeon]
MIGGIEKYWFLFGLATIFIIFAVVQDLRKREVANWLNFSLLGFALAYRAFFASFSGEIMFFVYGVIGAGLFFGLANLFYYSRMFAGGDAKLLMALGAVLPFESLNDFLYVGFGFLFALFLAGAVYSLCYSGHIVYRNSAKFKKEFAINYGKMMYAQLLVMIAIVVLVLIYALGGPINISVLLVLVVFPYAMFLLFIYLKSLDRCMIKYANANELTEGDWLEQEVRIGNYVIKKSVHGLSWDDIMKLRKAKKKALIKEGIPFTPAFLIAFAIQSIFFFSGFNLFLML